MYQAIATVSSPCAQDLVANGRDDRDQHDAAADHHDGALLADKGKGDDRQCDHHDQEFRAAALVRGRVLANLIRGQRVARLQCMDRHVLGAVVLEDASDVRREGNQHEIAHEQADPDKPLDEMLDEPVLDVANRGAREEQRHQEEHADADGQGDAEHEGDGTPADLDPLPRCRNAGRSDEPAGAHDQSLVEHHEAPHEWKARRPRAVKPGVESFGRPDD